MNVNELSVTRETNAAGMMPVSFDEKIRMAGVLARSGLTPKGMDTAEKVCVALQWGAELGLSPMVAVQNISVINGKPTLSADIMSAIASNSREYGGIRWEQQDEKAAKCVVTRIRANGTKEAFTGSFTMADAARAELANKDNWKKYPARMLKHRALSFALRDAFPDLLAGVYTPDEISEIPQERNVTPQADDNSDVPQGEARARQLTKAEADELSMMFKSGVFSDEEYQEAIADYNSGRASADEILEKTRRAYETRESALNADAEKAFSEEAGK